MMTVQTHILFSCTLWHLWNPAFAASPPPPALDACLNSTESSSCEFNTPNGMQTGRCQTVSAELACVPNTAPTNDNTAITSTETSEADNISTGFMIATNANLIPDTGQSRCYSAAGKHISCPAAGTSTYGQDAQYQGQAMSYQANSNGTVTDTITGLMWQQSPDLNGDGQINAGDKLTYTGALDYCQQLDLASYEDWQLPNIKQLYSLIDFSGTDPSGYNGTDTSQIIPFINTDYFGFGFGDTSAGERLIDAQYASSSRYVSTTMLDDETLFGVNFADGRIKGYGLEVARQDKTFYVICNRGDSNYGNNQWFDNNDGTITDNTHGLMWAQADSATGLDWEQALVWVEGQNASNYLGYNNWRLPNIKELQSLIDYSRSPESSGSAAIDPLFSISAISNEKGETDYPYFWSSTTHANLGQAPGANGAYVSFGRALGNMNGQWLDVHGAGAQRSDPKTGDPSTYPTGHGPQGDAIRIFNYVRLVRDADPVADTGADAVTFNSDNQRLNIAVVDAGSLGLYQLSLQLDSIDSDYSPGFVFKAISLSASSGEPMASYDGAQQILNIPNVVVDKISYQIELSLLNRDTGLYFVVTRLTPNAI